MIHFPKTILSVLLSSILLILAFPNFNLWPLAWLAFVPVFLMSFHSNGVKKIFLWYSLFGFLFFLSSIEWLRHVSCFGWIFVACVQAVYFGIFGMAAGWLIGGSRRMGLSLLALPLLWAVLEWARAEIPVWAFGFNLLAYSQSHNLAVGRAASWIGAYGVSALIMFVNVALFWIVAGHRGRDRKIFRRAFLALAVAAAFVVFGSVSAHPRARPEVTSAPDSVRLAVIQGNIPQRVKWDASRKSEIIETYLQLTRFINDQPGLIIWPEAAFPGFFNLDPEREKVIALSRELEAPILVGAPHFAMEKWQSDDIIYSQSRFFNSAYYVDSEFSPLNRYDKIRLVSFGEYVPFQAFFRRLGLDRVAKSLGVGDFSHGNPDGWLFRTENDIPFSVLICFEDTFPALAKQAVDRGARFLAVMTNDAWFMKSAAPYQHLQASVFRAIENGVPVVRSANTGVSAFIDARGNVAGTVRDKHGRDIFIAGGLVQEIDIRPRETFYRQAGHLFPYAASAVLLVISIACGVPLLRRKASAVTAGIFVILCGVAMPAFAEAGWVATEGEHFILEQERPDADFARSIFLKAENDLDRIVKYLNDPGLKKQWTRDRRVRIRMYETKESFLTETKAPEWSGGFANYESRAIVSFKNSNQFWNSTLPHEIGHLVLDDLTGKHQNVPKWLQEGFALTCEDRVRPELQWAVRDAASKGYLLPLKMLTIVAPGEQDTGGANTYYAQAQAFVRFLIDGHGGERFRNFILELAKGKSFEESIRIAYRGAYRSVDELEAAFFKSIQNGVRPQSTQGV